MLHRVRIYPCLSQYHSRAYPVTILFSAALQQRVQLDGTVYHSKQPSLSTHRHIPCLLRNNNLGSMFVQCALCKAKRLEFEPASPAAAMKGSSDPFGTPPEPPKTLYFGQTFQSKHFLQHTRNYNCAFSMNSFGYQEIRESGWNLNYKIHR